MENPNNRPIIVRRVPAALTADETMVQSESDPVSPTKEKKKYPYAVFFILSNEFCERFSYYGMRAILVLYLTRWLKFEKDQATSIFHGFSLLCYLMPLFGAVLADGFLGRYRTILYLSIIYFVGNLIVSTTALPPPEWIGPSIGLLLIAVGTGGIKSSVAPFGADQFAPGQEKEQQSFFSAFYFMINLGSTISMIVTPILRADVQCFGEDCYTLAFGVPAILMFLSLVIFLAGSSLYKKIPPTGNVIGQVFKCIYYGIKGKITSSKYEEKKHWLYHAEDKFETEFIEDVRLLLKVLFMFLPLPIFWALSDQQGSRWTLQAEHLNGDMGVFGTVKPDQVQALNPILILVLIPLFDKIIYPLLDKCGILNKPLQRMVVGLYISAGAFVVAGLVQIKLDNTLEPPLSTDETGMTIFNTLPCDIQVDSQLYTGNIPKYSKTDFLRQGEVNYQISFQSHCVSGVDTYKHKFKLSSGNSYRLFITKENDQLIVKQFDDTRTKARRGLALLSIYTPEDLGDIGFKNVVTLVMEKYQGVIKEDIGASVNVTQHTVSEYKELEPSTYDIYVMDEVFSNMSKTAMNVTLGQGGVYTAVIYLADNRLHVRLFTEVEMNTLSMAWMIPQYVLITVGEVLFSISGLSFAYTQAPDSLKTVVQSVWLLTVSMGDLVVIIVANIQAIPSQMAEFFLFAVLMFLDTVIFMVMSKFYKYKPNSLYNMADYSPLENDTTQLVSKDKGEDIPLQTHDKAL